jgi:hypothetical protein
MRLPHRLDLASSTVQTTQPQLVGKVPVLLEAMKILLLAMTTVAGPLGKTRVILLLVENGSRPAREDDGNRSTGEDDGTRAAGEIDYLLG